MKLVFKAIKKDSIFEPEYQNLSSDNGTVEFKHMNSRGGIAVVYAPNGTGKSSLAKVLEAEESNDSMSFVATDDSGKAIIPEAKAFFVIPDQINRNVIRGKETDYFIGQQIRREYELRDRINTMFDMAFTSLGQKYKSDYGVSKVGDYILTQIGSVPDESYSTAFAFIRSIVNARQHGKDIDQRAFIDYIRNEYNKPTLVSLNDEMKKWIITDVSKEKITEHLINLDYHAITPNVETVQIEQHDDAINILKKYHSAESCIVCDNPNFDGDVLLARKTETRKRMYDELDQHTKTLLDKVVKDSSLVASDPFDIKRIVSDFIAGGESAELQQLQVTLSIYVRGIGDEMVDALFHCFDGTDMIRDFDEFVQLTEGQPVLDSEEILFIEEIINESIGKDITIVRDQDSRNYKLKLGEKDLIGVNREEMELSSGEQNFISLAFELLLARHSAKEYVVLDDPISSFDSVYKNKIAYCIVKFLEDKKQLVLTHNTDLIRLLEVQLNNCFNLYILNNVENGHNGFIPIEEKEKKLLINLHELIKFFQNKDGRLVSVIHNRRFFMMAMVPFMRGYAHINLDSNDYFGRLSDIMHDHGGVEGGKRYWLLSSMDEWHYTGVRTIARMRR